MTAEIQPHVQQPVMLATVEHRLRQHHRLMLLPPTAATATVLGSGWMHERMMATLATGGAEMLLVGIGGGVVTALLSTGGALLYAARAGALDGLPPLRKLLGGSVGAGVALALFGDAVPVVVAAYAGGLLGVARWYRTRWLTRGSLKRERYALAGIAAADEPGAEAGPVVVDAEVVDPDEYVARWAHGAVHHLPDTRLVPLPGPGLCYVVQGGPRGVSLEAANAARDRIAAALRLALPGPAGGGQDILFDQPGGGVLADRSQLRAQIVDLSTVAAAGRRVTDEVVTAPGRPGSIRLGGYIDDASDYYYDLADGDGAWSGVLLGGTGMGKSSVGDNLAYKIMRLGFELAYLDPQQGASSPVLARHAHFPALGVEMAEPFLRFLEDCADTRETWMAMHGLGTITWDMTAPCLPDGADPDPDCPCGGVVPPGLVAHIEECDQVFNHAHAGTTTRLAERYGQLAKRIRKLNMAIVAATQMPELKTFGGSELLRSNLPVRNLLAMHISSNVSGTLIPGLPYSPKLLPKTPGRGLACGRDTRTMQVAADYLPRRQKAAEGVPGPYAEDLFEAMTPVGTYGPDAAAAARHFPATGSAAAAASREAARARFTAKASGVVTAPTPAPAQPPVAHSLIRWPKPVVSTGWQPRDEQELRGALDAAVGLVNDLVTAVRGMPDGEWVTVGELARRMGRVPPGATDGRLRAAARGVGLELAAAGITLRKREPGVSVTAGQIRSAWN